MPWLERHDGCPPPSEDPTCWGPVGEYYTLFGSELAHLEGHLLVAAAAAIAVFAVLVYLRRDGRIRWPWPTVPALAAAWWLVLFVALAYFFPVHVVY